MATGHQDPREHGSQRGCARGEGHPGALAGGAGGGLGTCTEQRGAQLTGSAEQQGIRSERKQVRAEETPGTW